MMKYFMAILCVIMFVTQGMAGDVAQLTSQSGGIMIEPTLNIAEIPYENGTVRFRYSRYLSKDKTKWIRHGLFRAYHANGTLASEGNYEHGLETGAWKDYHPNGQLAAKGAYSKGEKVGVWEYWNENGVPAETETF